MTVARTGLTSLLLVTSGVLIASPAQAASTCPPIEDAKLRLECYDREAGRTPAARSDRVTPSAATTAGSPAPGNAPSVPLPAPTIAAPEPLNTSPPAIRGGVAGAPAQDPQTLLPATSPVAQAVRDVRRSLGTTLSDQWELNPDQDRGRFVVRPYKPMYLLPAVWTSHSNRSPSSPNPTNTVTSPLTQQSTELKFQISLKSKVWQDPVGSGTALWLGYTQTSFWQVYDGAASRPFRETNYEPEVLLVTKTDYTLFGWHGRLAGVSLNHMSNGRADPLSRSWNRIIGMVGLEKDNWMVMVRPWWRIPEKNADDNNPEIQNFYGRAELLVVRKSEGHELSLLARHSLRSGDNSHGSLQMDYAFPLSSFLKGYVQLFTGYGDSLIDYNARQTRFGVGISITQWL